MSCRGHIDDICWHGGTWVVVSCRGNVGKCCLACACHPRRVSWVVWWLFFFVFPLDFFVTVAKKPDEKSGATFCLDDSCTGASVINFSFDFPYVAINFSFWSKLFNLNLAFWILLINAWEYPWLGSTAVFSSSPDKWNEGSDDEWRNFKGRQNNFSC